MFVKKFFEILTQNYDKRLQTFGKIKVKDSINLICYVPSLVRVQLNDNAKHGTL